MFKIVITKERNQELVSAVPEGWEKDNVLFWPPVMKKTILESLKKDALSVPALNWKKMECRVKIGYIKTYEEALELEDFYTSAISTEDEESTVNTQSKNKEKDVNSDFNSYFETEQCGETKSAPMNISNIEDQYKIPDLTPNIVDIEYNSQSTPIEINNEPDDINLQTSFLNINSMEYEELKKQIKDVSDAIMTLNIKIDKSLENENKILEAFNSFQTVSNINKYPEMEIVGVEFPIDSVENLMKFETFLADPVRFHKMVTTLYRVCGTSGVFKVNKSGLILIRYMFKDDLLNKYTWRGVAGTNKLAFCQLNHTRKLLFEVLKMSDNTCSMCSVDLFLQNSALKHSGQRIKRKLKADINGNIVDGEENGENDLEGNDGEGEASTKD